MAKSSLQSERRQAKQCKAIVPNRLRSCKPLKTAVLHCSVPQVQLGIFDRGIARFDNEGAAFKRFTSRLQYIIDDHIVRLPAIWRNGAADVTSFRVMKLCAWVRGQQFLESARFRGAIAAAAE